MKTKLTDTELRDTFIARRKRVLTNDAEHVFFEGMRRRYANRAQSGQVSELPGSHLITHFDGEYALTDCWFVNTLSLMSEGFTVIRYRTQPIWMMHYGGFYTIESFTFLQQCLSEAYIEKKFFGGRGPLTKRSKEFLYSNHPSINQFSNFDGHEFIINENLGTRVSSFWYRGGMMFA